ncbi:BolA family protein [Buchnera aphidicola]
MLKKIKKFLISQMKIVDIEIYNDSNLHYHSKKCLTHLRLLIISDDFVNQTSVFRHQKIFLMLQKVNKKKIYSITLYTYTLSEWKDKKNKKIHCIQCFKKRKNYFL